MSSVIDNNNLNDYTPSKKRKRNAENITHLCSTPKHQNVVAFDNPGLDLAMVSPKFYCNKENVNFNPDAFMETKSILDLVEGNNPFEIIRKPPKKKKRHDVKENCFINPALNLNGPENEPVNPFEVKRPVSLNLEEDNHCFSNPALSIRGPETRTNFNPFEVTRREEIKGIENHGLEALPPLSIGLPFTPTVGRRINFKDLPFAALTPSGLLAKHLVFSPEIENDTPSRKSRNLSVISEEPLNIEEELDCYQLVLENSINEAKTKSEKWKGTLEPKKLTNIIENEPESSIDTGKPVSDSTFVVLDKIIEVMEENEEEQHIEASNDNTKNETQEDNQDIFNNDNEENIDCDDVQYEEVEDSRNEDDDFKTPAPFTRTFRRSVRIPATQEINIKSDENTHNNFSTLLRKSLRKLIHPNQKVDRTDKPEKKKLNDDHGFISAIRSSFRRKQKPEILQSTAIENSNDISIIDTSVKRQIFRQPEANAVLEPAPKITQTNSTIRSSFRKSTKDARKQMMKSVFKKTVENYEFDGK